MPAGAVQDPLETLFASRPMGTAEWGLDRILALVTALGNPQDAFDTVHIAGTNGKGSTAAFTAAILAAQGHEVGAYTSPHLYDITERFRVGSRPVERATLSAVAEMIERLPESSEATYFEVATALAFEAFRRVGVEWGVIEVGLGGRLDATNVIRPRVAAVTTIGLDHAGVLGGTLEEIAAEKAGILKRGVPVALGDMPPAAREVLEGAAVEVGGEIFRLGVDGVVTDVAADVHGTRFRYTSGAWPGGVEFRTSMVGAYQARNAGLALLSLEAAEVPLDRQAAVDAVGRTSIPGRFEIRRPGDAMWVLDIAHNREGLDVLLSTLEEVGMPRPRVAVISILADKPWSGMLGMLRLDVDAIILTQTTSAPDARRWNLEEVVEDAEWDMVDLRVESDLGAALEVARRIGVGGTIIVTGSTHTVSEAGRLLGRS